MKQYYYLLCLLLAAGSVLSQSGKEFWFVAPEVTSGHSDQPVLLRISTYSDPAVVTISQPANSAFVTRTVTLSAQETQSIDLTSDLSLLENEPANTVLNKGLYISSTGTISAYYEVKSNGNNTDIFSLKGPNALGENFMIPAQSFWSNSSGYTPAPYNGFEIVATEDSTEITITPTKNVVGHSANTPFTVTLNKGQSYSVRSISGSASQHLGGTEVISNRPIAITLTDDSGYNIFYGGCEDLMGDQLIPVKVTGKEYIVIKGFFFISFFSIPDQVIVTATENNTQIYIDGSAFPVTTLDKGEQYEFALWGSSTYIQGSKDIYVLHVTGFGCEPGSAVLPRLSCSGSEQVSFTRSSSSDFYMLLLVPAGGQGQFQINGNGSLVSASDFFNVPGTGGLWKAARKKFSITEIVPGNNYIITNANVKFHAGIINGGASTGCMYGFFSDFNSVITDPIYHY